MQVTDVLGILWNNKKNEYKQEVTIFSYKLDTVRLVIRLPAIKRIKL
jgi:hypothetical protein